MKVMFKKSFALFMATIICLSALFGMNLSVFAADSNVVNYVYDGSYVYNWGEREEEATFLSPMAIDFYTKNGVTLNSLLAYDGDGDTSKTPYSDLYDKLSSLMEDNHDFKTSYDGTKTLYGYTDCENSNTSNMSAFYSGKQLTSKWDSAATWNREHTWPNSKSNSGKSYTNRETDIIMLRPATPNNNSSRGNTAYGESGSYFNPNKFVGTTGYDVRGDAARAILYVYVRWGGSDSHDGALDYMWGSSGVIESKDILLKWMQEDPVDTWEMGRNDATESITGTRNIFIDYPELAFDLFGASIPSYTTPSGYAASNGTVGGEIVGDGSSSGNVSGGTTGDSNNDAPVVEGDKVTFEFGSNGEAKHSDGGEATAYSETIDGCTLTLSTLSKVYKNARDAKGNSALKLGTGSATGSFSLTAPDNVIRVIFNVAGYKAKTVTVNVNGKAQSITTTSDNGTYTAIEVDTTSTKNITFATSTNYRCMIDSITYVIAGSDNTEDNKTYVDENDIVISGSANAFPEGAVVYAEKIAMGENSTIDTALSTVAEKFVAFDLTAKVGDTISQLNQGKKVNITLPIPEGYDTEKVAIVYIPDTNEDDSEVEILESVVDTQANTISAELTHFSYYAVIEKATPAADDGEQGGSGGSGGATVETQATITFDANKTQRTEYSTEKQVWENDGLIFTNNKGSGSSVGNYSNPVRVYKGSQVTIEYPNMHKFEIDVTGITSSYDFWVNSINAASGVTASKSGSIVTAVFDRPVDSLTITLSGQSRANSITAYGTTASGGDTPDTPTYTVTAQTNNAAYGTVTQVGYVITAEVNDGYKLMDGDAAYTVTPAGAATVVRNNNTFTVTPSANVRVQINFEAIPTYTATFVANGETIDTISKISGTEITLPQYDSSSLATNIRFQNWLSDIDGKSYRAGASYLLTANVTFTAQFLTVETNGEETKDATITFDNPEGKRTNLTDEQQVWEENNIVVTNNKTKDSNAIAESSNPIRFYKNSELIIANSSPMTKIVVNTSESEYATALADSIFDENTAISVDDTAVTIEFGESVYDLTIILSAGQVRVNAITVYTIKSNDDAPKYIVTFIENGKVTSKLEFELNTEITLPNISGSATEEILGWQASNETTTRDPGSKYKVSGDVTFTAKYKVTEGEGGSGGATNVTSTITFDDKAKRTQQTTLLQVWTENDITVTNNKASSTTSVADYAKPARFYAGSNLVVEYAGGNITQIVFDANSTDYANNLKASIGTISGATVTSSSDKVTVTFAATVELFTIAKLNAQVRMDAITVTAQVGGGAAEKIGEIKGAQVSVGSDLSLKYYVDLINVTDISNVVMQFTLDGKTTTVACKSENMVDGKYVFTLDNIPPQAMTAEITAVLLDGDNTLATMNYTVRDNADNLLAAYPNDAKLKQFIVDMLYYGAAAQEYTGYNVGELANAGISDEPSSAAPISTDFTLFKSTGTAKFKSANIYFDSTLSIVIKIENAGNATLKVNGEEKTITNGIYTVEGILATQFGDTFKFELIENDEVVQTLTYSVNAYAYSKWESPTISALAQALYRYGVSAKEYADSIA